MRKISLICAFLVISMLYADEFDERKKELERQIAELEAIQKQQEMEALERRLNELKNKTPQQPRNPYQNTQQDTQNYPYTPYAKPLTQNNQAQNTKNTKDREQSIRDEEVKKTFGKNRNGVLLGIGYGMIDVDFKSAGGKEASGNISLLSLRLGYQRFPTNKNFGFRMYIDGFAGAKEVGIYKTTYTQIVGAYNLDILLDFHLFDYTYLGLFAGVGYGIMGLHYEQPEAFILQNGETNTLQMPTGFFNAGVAWTSNARHRIEFYAKIPMKTTYNEKFYFKGSAFPSVVYQFTF